MVRKRFPAGWQFRKDALRRGAGIHPHDTADLFSRIAQMCLPKAILREIIENVSLRVIGQLRPVIWQEIAKDVRLRGKVRADRLTQFWDQIRRLFDARIQNSELMREDACTV